MKKRLLIMATIVVGLGLTACSVDTSGLEDAADKMEQDLNEATDKIDAEIEETKVTESTSTVMDQCPDDCQNGPAFFKPGPCKSCGKDMVEI